MIGNKTATEPLSCGAMAVIDKCFMDKPAGGGDENHVFSGGMIARHSRDAPGPLAAATFYLISKSTGSKFKCCPMLRDASSAVKQVSHESAAPDFFDQRIHAPRHVL